MQGAYQTNVLLAGYDADKGPSLYYLDYLAALHPVKHTAMGYCKLRSLHTGLLHSLRMAVRRWRFRIAASILLIDSQNANDDVSLCIIGCMLLHSAVH